MPDQKCTGTARIHVVTGSTSLLPIYATAVGSLHGLSAAGKSGDDVDIYGLYTERKKEVGKMKETTENYRKRIIEMIENMDNIYWLRSIYVFMKTLLS